MKKNSLILGALLISITNLIAQTNPAISSWLQNTTVTGSYYMAGNSTAISNNL